MKLVIFTDLDGTLLDHASYSYAPAQEALAHLARHSVPLVLATSKTAAEVMPLRDELGLGDTPAIVENGAGILEREATARMTATPYRDIQSVLSRTDPALRRHFVGFGDVTAEKVATWTGLSIEQAIRAQDRQFSEPGLWKGDAESLGAFKHALREEGITARHGGRFLTLSHGRTKADAMAQIAARLQADQTLALGDAPNDVEMLERADMGVIVRNDHGKALGPLKGEATGRIRRTEQEGPAGWNHAVLEILAELNLD